jgi:hypothetical protein
MATFLGAIKGSIKDSLNLYNQRSINQLEDILETMSLTDIRKYLKYEQSFLDKNSKDMKAEEKRYNQAKIEAFKNEIKRRGK